MSRPTAAWAAWTLFGVALAFALVGLLFGILAFLAALPVGRGPMLGPMVVQGVLAVLYGTPGALRSLSSCLLGRIASPASARNQ